MSILTDLFRQLLAWFGNTVLRITSVLSLLDLDSYPDLTEDLFDSRTLVGVSR